jgi:hypothetical protein
VDLLHCWWSVGRPAVCGLEDGSALYYVVPMGGKEWRFFEDSERSSEDLLYFFFNTLFTWAAAWLAPTVITFSDFLYLFSSPS